MAYDPRMAYDPNRLLSDGDVQAGKAPGWWGDDGRLWREFTFDTYQAGVDFAVRVAAHAEAENHHPDLLIGYRKVKVTYFTHDAGGITALDLAGSRAVNDLYGA
ncbi:4a-hydroxytetrahydrobiopterin dehydratase [Deinococcus metalli]|uniref:4a-hydroxytetrahydrobiopterin dehydratase n=1 Tax=Deinococcus metalli TaxID=1141878 RepID=A0A7W8KH49_9DEIO|nr:4a-hydroxytetrahydrobiopterin dehydratase [Deinococcus metalli]MBB5377820.1 4a-hydroxytetrahydrobiopterin dehydratase [Deinococcus metalli]GHF55700.1 putative pterin-4-alpha-carbinolamine dehydratase [Deinococcus metalli]